MTAREEYDELVRIYLPVLKRYLGRMPEHGMKTYCPECGEVGKIDLKTDDLRFAFKNSIYFAAWNGTWRCILCDRPY